MNRIATYLNSLGRMARTTLVALAVVFLSAGIVQAATTISTNVSTGGTLAVTGLSSLGQASTTIFSATGVSYFGGTATSSFSAAGVLTAVGNTSLVTASTTGAVSIAGALWVGGNATTTAAGAISTQSTLGVTGLSTLTAGFVSQASSTVVGAVTVTGDTTLASTTATGMKVGQVGTRMTRIVSGYCVTGSITIPATNASSTQTYADCTPSGGTSIITSGDRVFLQATSSLPYYVVIQAASSTAGGLVNVGLTNFSTSTSPAAAVYGFNFWAFQ